MSWTIELIEKLLFSMKRKSNNVLRNKRRCSKFSRTLKQELGYSHWRYLIERELSAISYRVYHVQTSSGVSCYRACEFLFFFLRHFPTESFFVVGVSAAFVHNQEWQQQWLDFDCRQLLRASGVFIFFYDWRLSPYVYKQLYWLTFFFLFWWESSSFYFFRPGEENQKKRRKREHGARLQCDTKHPSVTGTEMIVSRMWNYMFM